MARLWLIAVLLLSSASAGSCGKKLPVKQNEVSKPTEDLIKKPDETQIAQIVTVLLKGLNKDERKLPMFSLAVSIPYDNNKKEYNVSKVTDDLQTVKNKILDCGVYSSERMVAATLLKWDDVLKQCPNAQVPWDDVLTQCNKPSMTWAEVKAQCSGAVKQGRADHAEYRVLQNFNTLKYNPYNKKDFLLFYVHASPCDQKCASADSPFSILDGIGVITKWANYAVVFSKVFVPRGGVAIPSENLKGALKRLGEHEVHLGPIGLQNILRCDDSVSCTSCSDGHMVTRYCYNTNAPKPQPKPRPNAPSNSAIVPQSDQANRRKNNIGKSPVKVNKRGGALFAGRR